MSRYGPEFDRCEAAWLAPDEFDDPLERVEFPRERKPWKRDREAVRVAMQGAINKRCWANVNEADGRTRDHAVGWREFEHGKFQLRRELIVSSKPRMHPDAWRYHLAYIRRCILAHRRFDNSPLPK